MLDIHHDDPKFGYRFIADELERAGWVVSENRVQRLCRDNKIWSTTANKRGLNRKAGQAAMATHHTIVAKPCNVKYQPASCFWSSI